MGADAWLFESKSTFAELNNGCLTASEAINVSCQTVLCWLGQFGQSEQGMQKREHFCKSFSQKFDSAFSGVLCVLKNCEFTKSASVAKKFPSHPRSNQLNFSKQREARVIQLSALSGLFFIIRKSMKSAHWLS